MLQDPHLYLLLVGITSGKPQGNLDFSMGSGDPNPSQHAGMSHMSVTSSVLLSHLNCAITGFPCFPQTRFMLESIKKKEKICKCYFNGMVPRFLPHSVA